MSLLTIDSCFSPCSDTGPLLWTTDKNGRLYKTPSTKPHLSLLTVIVSVQGVAKEAPKLFNPAEEYDEKSVLLVTLSQKTITLTAKEVTGMPWPQFVRLMKVRLNGIFVHLLS